jgi:hypothetical protein
MRSALLPLLLVAVLAAPGRAVAADTAEQEIEYLLRFVAASGCTFIRNGDAHDAPDAADHLRLKYNRGRRYADSAEHFIDRLATQSSWSGETYTVTCAGDTRGSGQWLHQALEQYRQDSDPNNPAS